MPSNEDAFPVLASAHAPRPCYHRPVANICSRGHEFTGSPPCPTCYPGYRTFRFRAEVWLYPGQSAAWHFVTLPKKISDTVHERFDAFARGWGSQRVSVTVGKTTFDTSIFPDNKRGGYLLPLKAKVRKAEDIVAGKTMTFTVHIQA